MASNFEVGEYSFQVKNLKVKTSLHLFKQLAKTLLPAIATASAAPAGQIGDAIERVVSNLDSLDDLLDCFVAVSTYTGPGRDNPTELKPLCEHVFGGHPERVVEYLIRCVEGEYGAFLGENGLLSSLQETATNPSA